MIETETIKRVRMLERDRLLLDMLLFFDRYEIRRNEKGVFMTFEVGSLESPIFGGVNIDVREALTHAEEWAEKQGLLE